MFTKQFCNVYSQISKGASHTLRSCIYPPAAVANVCSLEVRVSQDCLVCLSPACFCGEEIVLEIYSQAHFHCFFGGKDGFLAVGKIT